MTTTLELATGPTNDVTSLLNHLIEICHTTIKRDLVQYDREKKVLRRTHTLELHLRHAIRDSRIRTTQAFINLLTEQLGAEKARLERGTVKEALDNNDPQLLQAIKEATENTHGEEQA